jgi:hypothetical protein
MNKSLTWESGDVKYNCGNWSPLAGIPCTSITFCPEEIKPHSRATLTAVRILSPK